MNDRALFPAVFFRLGVSEVNIDSWTKARGEGLVGQLKKCAMLIYSLFGKRQSS